MAIKKKRSPAKLPAAVAMAKRATDSLTPEQRKERGRNAVNARWRKAKSPSTPQRDRWYELVALPADYVWRGTAHAAEVLAEVDANPEVILASHDRAEIIARSNRRDLRNRTTLIIERAYNPNGLTIQREYKPDAGAQLKGIRAVLDTDGGKS